MEERRNETAVEVFQSNSASTNFSTSANSTNGFVSFGIEMVEDDDEQNEENQKLEENQNASDKNFTITQISPSTKNQFLNLQIQKTQKNDDGLNKILMERMEKPLLTWIKKMKLERRGRIPNDSEIIAQAKKFFTLVNNEKNFMTPKNEEIRNWVHEFLERKNFSTDERFSTSKSENDGISSNSDEDLLGSKDKKKFKSNSDVENFVSDGNFAHGGTGVSSKNQFGRGRAEESFDANVGIDANKSGYAAVGENSTVGLLNAESNFRNPLNEFEDERLQRMIVCLLCDLPKELGSMMAHIREHLQYYPYQCKSCEFITADVQAMVDHSESNSEDHEGFFNSRPYKEFIVQMIAEHCRQADDNMTLDQLAQADLPVGAVSSLLKRRRGRPSTLARIGITRISSNSVNSVPIGSESFTTPGQGSPPRFRSPVTSPNQFYTRRKRGRPPKHSIPELSSRFVAALTQEIQTRNQFDKSESVRNQYDKSESIRNQFQRPGVSGLTPEIQTRNQFQRPGISSEIPVGNQFQPGISSEIQTRNQFQHGISSGISSAGSQFQRSGISSEIQTRNQFQPGISSEIPAGNQFQRSGISSEIQTRNQFQRPGISSEIPAGNQFQRPGISVGSVEEGEAPKFDLPFSNLSPTSKKRGRPPKMVMDSATGRIIPKKDLNMPKRKRGRPPRASFPPSSIIPESADEALNGNQNRNGNGNYGSDFEIIDVKPANRNLNEKLAAKKMGGIPAELENYVKIFLDEPRQWQCTICSDFQASTRFERIEHVILIHMAETTDFGELPEDQFRVMCREIFNSCFPQEPSASLSEDLTPDPIAADPERNRTGYCRICECRVNPMCRKDHLKKYHVPVPKIYCFICGKNWTNANSLQKHLANLHGIGGELIDQWVHRWIQGPYNRCYPQLIGLELKKDQELKEKEKLASIFSSVKIEFPYGKLQLQQWVYSLLEPRCNLCGENFPSDQLQYDHVIFHLESPANFFFKCGYCEFGAVSLEEIAAHLMALHPTEYAIAIDQRIVHQAAIMDKLWKCFKRD